MDELIDEREVLKEKRGKTLPVLCILSWIAIGITLISVGNNIITGKATQEELDEEKYEILKNSNEEMEILQEITTETVEVMQITNDNYWIITGVNLFNVILGFFAVLLMYRLKKYGYYLYILYCLIPVILSLTFFSGYTITTWGLLFNGVFSILFIILYGVQYKRMS